MTPIFRSILPSNTDTDGDDGDGTTNSTTEGAADV